MASLSIHILVQEQLKPDTGKNVLVQLGLVVMMSNNFEKFINVFSYLYSLFYKEQTSTGYDTGDLGQFSV